MAYYCKKISYCKYSFCQHYSSCGHRNLPTGTVLKIPISMHISGGEGIHRVAIVSARQGNLWHCSLAAGVSLGYSGGTLSKLIGREKSSWLQRVKLSHSQQHWFLIDFVAPSGSEFPHSRKTRILQVSVAVSVALIANCLPASYLPRFIL